MADKDLNDLFLEGLKDIYWAEKRILKSLPKMATAASSAKLRAAFKKHHEETELQIERLERIFDLLDKNARGKKCKAVAGILEEFKSIVAEYESATTLDAGFLAAAQALEPYQIARYGTLKCWAAKLFNPEAMRLFDETLKRGEEDRRCAEQDRQESGSGSRLKELNEEACCSS